MRKLQQAVSFILCLLNISVFGQGKYTNSLLWEISGNGLKKPSYLYGTIHLMCPTDIQISEATKQKLAATEQLVLELDFDDPGIMQQIQQKAMMPNHQTLQDFLDEEDYKVVSQFFQDSLGVSLQQVDRFDPIVLTSIVAVHWLQCQPGSYEQMFTQLASQQDKEVVGLETVDEQFASLRKLSYAQQAAYLTETIREYDESKQEFANMIEAYKSQQVDQLQQIMQESMDDVGEQLITHLLVERNHNWVPEMQELMQQKPAFFAVGAGHLGGAEGVITLLREKGYTVKPVLQ